ncbi:disulfide bond formation protein B [Pseudomonas viridiflava]|uniref:disulfide bond formation protein B n=1 Tax=Pseudomonas viridiflava TaxID=33069 RepID=UPI001F11DC55|nr:disulfide bond formation protein B [Pseudomonas viridiflava]
MHLARTRSLFFLAFLTCALLIAAVPYLQHAFGLEPCLLCLSQRRRWSVAVCSRW